MAKLSSLLKRLKINKSASFSSPASPQSNLSSSIVSPGVIPEAIDIPIQKEQEYFYRKNDLVEEFFDPPPLISPSDFSKEKPWKYTEEYKGYMIACNHESDIQDHKDLIDTTEYSRLLNMGILPIEIYNKLYNRAEIKDDPNEILHEYIEGQEKILDYLKSLRPKTKISDYSSGIDNKSKG